MESIGMTPIGWSGDLFSSAGRYPRPRPIVRYSSSLVFLSSVAMWASGFRISTPLGRSMSRAGISPGPVTTSGASTSVASECMRHTMPLRFRTMSVTSSVTPLIVENSCATPSIRTEVTAAPASDASSTRRSELPKVYPKPRSSGSTTNWPRLSSTDSAVIRGIWKSSIRVLTSSGGGAGGHEGERPQGTRRAQAVARPGVEGGLLRVQLDDELLLHRRGDLRALGLAQHLRRQLVVIGLQPGGHLGHQLGGVADDLLGAGLRLDGDDVVLPYL